MHQRNGLLILQTIEKAISKGGKDYVKAFYEDQYMYLLQTMIQKSKEQHMFSQVLNSVFKREYKVEPTTLRDVMIQMIRNKVLFSEIKNLILTFQENIDALTYAGII